MTQIFRDIAGLRANIARQRDDGAKVAFVPTMGNLHAGHMRLMRKASEHADFRVASIYVNPMQFGEGEDYGVYPRTPEADIERLEREGVDALFMPDDETVYPRGVNEQTFVEVPGLSDILEGAHRPGHFRGVATVVNRLFNLVTPDIAVFGKKDYQQLAVIRRMVDDLGMPIEIVGVETERELDGLAMSSRNGYLTPELRALATMIYAELKRVQERVMQADQVSEGLCADSIAVLNDAGFTVDYVVLRRQADLAVPEAGDAALVALVAARLGKVRLIDNLEMTLNQGS